MTQWRKSTHSGASNNTDCVELATIIEGIGLRDSKAPQEGHVAIVPEAFASLVQKIKAGQLDL
ncbi:DUF397 domain-containing protein [Actinomadura vinacea]|uniref:DUF397 domain-containing protein n=1 Tax=Actinomadura vinacea TaxID=115336 RepID=A0ABP5WD70_9ACTN